MVTGRSIHSTSDSDALVNTWSWIDLGFSCGLVVDSLHDRVNATEVSDPRKTKKEEVLRDWLLGDFHILR